MARFSVGLRLGDCLMGLRQHMDIINPCLERIVIYLRRTDADQQDDLGIARIVLVPAIVQRFPRLGERHRKYQPKVDAGLDQAPSRWDGGSCRSLRRHRSPACHWLSASRSSGPARPACWERTNAAVLMVGTSIVYLVWRGFRIGLLTSTSDAIGLGQPFNPAGTLFRYPWHILFPPLATSFKVLTGRLIRAWNSRILGTISLRKREPLNTP